MQVRFKADTIGPHFHDCVPKWGKKREGTVHIGSRVEVKFYDKSEAGFTWYPHQGLPNLWSLQATLANAVPGCLK